MKSYTDLEQSKKLAKILPLESADMYYTPPLIKGHTDYIPHLKRKLPIGTVVKVTGKYILDDYEFVITK